MGCGDGAFALELTKCGAIVTGIDASAATIDAAKDRAKQRNSDATFQVAMADHLPFPADQFDIVTAITILCFVDDATRIFREIARVLRPGGRLVIAASLANGARGRPRRRVRAWLGSRLWRQGRFRTASELRGLAEQAGLVVKSVQGAIYYPRWSSAARLLIPSTPTLGRLTPIGASFVALSAIKPAAGA